DNSLRPRGAILTGIWKNEPFGLFMQTVSRRSAARARNSGFAIGAHDQPLAHDVDLDYDLRGAYGPPQCGASTRRRSFGRSGRAEVGPQRRVRVTAPSGAGGNSDGMARIVAQRLTDAFEQTFVVENRLGANGAIATEAVARSPADGYTLLWGATPPLTINP